MSLQTVALWLAAAQAAALIGIGLVVWIAPHFAAKNYGVTLEGSTALALLRGLGMRDLSLGLAIFLALRLHPPSVPWLLFATSPIALSDLASVSRLGAPLISRLTHFGGALALIVTGLLLLLA